MKIGIISDTHNRVAGVDQAVAFFEAQKVALILHCGDWTTPESARYFAEKLQTAGIPLKGVLGNNDRDTDAFLTINEEYSDFKLHEGVLEHEIDGRSIRVYHGHHKPTLQRLLREPVDLLCLGHSHKPRYDILDHQIVINPGSTAFAIPRSKAWRASVAIYDTGRHEAEFMYF